jgi:hypothetical protein
MPASAAALHRAGIIETTDHFANSTPVGHAHLQILGDVLAIPKGWPLANVFSIGDIVIVIGAVVTIYSICGVRTRRVLSATNT